VQILKNNIKKLVLKGHWRTRPIQNSPTGRFLHLGLVHQINPYKTRSLIYYKDCLLCLKVLFTEVKLRFCNILIFEGNLL
jgi:hypothetical protein